MKRTSAQKTAPVITKVINRVVSIVPQLDASGVNHHGLIRLKMTDPTTKAANMIATVIARSPRFFLFEKTDFRRWPKGPSGLCNILGVGPKDLLDSAML